MSILDLNHPIIKAIKDKEYQLIEKFPFTSNDINQEFSIDGSNYNLLTYALTKKYNEGKPCLEIINYLMNKGANPEILLTRKKLNPMHLLCFYNEPNLLNLLLKYSSEANCPLNVDINGYPLGRSNISHLNGYTLLHLTISEGNFSNIKILLDRGANINAKNCMGETPLHLLIKKHQEHPDFDEIMKLLIFNKADLSMRNNMKLTPLDYMKDVVKKIKYRNDASQIQI